MRLSRRWWVLVPICALVYLAATYYLPYYSLGPGPARAVQPLIRFDEGERYESDGAFVLTSVAFRQLTGAAHRWIEQQQGEVGVSHEPAIRH